jgi:hypothetical protein
MGYAGINCIANPTGEVKTADGDTVNPSMKSETCDERISDEHRFFVGTVW